MDDYCSLLKKIRKYFPQPVSHPKHDAYFANLIYKTLHCLDQKKSHLPYYGKRKPVNFHRRLPDWIPERLGKVEKVIPKLVDVIEGLPVWGHPQMMENVVSSSPITSIIGTVIAAIANPNMVGDEYSHQFAKAEQDVVKAMAELVGYDPIQAGGVFTFGGTGTVMYGIKMGLQDVCPEHVKVGIRKDVRIVFSEKSHHVKFNVASWMGIGTNQIATVRCCSDNSMDLEDLDKTVQSCFQKGIKIACIVLTLGTTDAFGLDPLSDVIKLREKWKKMFPGLGHVHIHADAVIGWAWSFFNDYDFDSNGLKFSDRCGVALKSIVSEIQNLHLADSIGIDFHKTGYCPYTSSLFLVAQGKKLLGIGRDKKDIPYLFHEGCYRPGMFTLECSRSAVGVLAAQGSLQLLGKQGFQVALGHSIEMSQYLRSQIRSSPSIAVCNMRNVGPVVLLRMYPPSIDGKKYFLREMSGKVGPQDMKAINRFNHDVFDALHQRMLSSGGPALSWTDEYQRVKGISIPAMKAFFLNPFVNSKTVRELVFTLDELGRSMWDTGRYLISLEGDRSDSESKSARQRKNAS